MNLEKITELERDLINLKSDPDAFYAKELFIDLSSIEPHISGPNSVKTMTSISEIREKKIKIDKAYLLSCVNSRVDDIAEAAEIVRGKTFAAHVKFYIAAASKEVQNESEKRGDWQVLLKAGAIELPPSCGPCIGLGTGLLEDGEVGISATNRNFKGRMGSPNTQAYLASPAVVAASAVAGYITYEFSGSANKLSGNVQINPKPAKSKSQITIISGFPAYLEGELIFCHQDNLNTDGIYPGKYTYNDDMTPDDQAKVVMENYDTEFGKIVKNGDILAGGFNFGTGSSREQAATSLKFRGIKLVIAGSFSETYKRNALNNGFPVIECPDLINDLKSKYGKDKLTVKTGIRILIDFQSSILEIKDKTYNFDPLGVAAQELIVAGGLEEWVRNNL